MLDRALKSRTLIEQRLSYPVQTENDPGQRDDVNEYCPRQWHDHHRYLGLESMLAPACIHVGHRIRCTAEAVPHHAAADYRSIVIPAQYAEDNQYDDENKHNHLYKQYDQER